MVPVTGDAGTGPGGVARVPAPSLGPDGRRGGPPPATGFRVTGGGDSDGGRSLTLAVTLTEPEAGMTRMPVTRMMNTNKLHDHLARAGPGDSEPWPGPQAGPP